MKVKKGSWSSKIRGVVGRKGQTTARWVVTDHGKNKYLIVIFVILFIGCKKTNDTNFFIKKSVEIVTL